MLPRSLPVIFLFGVFLIPVNHWPPKWSKIKLHRKFVKLQLVFSYYSTVGCRRTVCRRTARLEFHLKKRTTPGWKNESRTVSPHANSVCCEDDFFGGIADFETTPLRPRASSHTVCALQGNLRDSKTDWKIRTRLAGVVEIKNDPGWDRLPHVLRHPTVLYYPGQKKNHHRDSRREERCSTCDIMVDQARSAQGKRDPRLSATLPCGDRAWSGMISHVEQRSSRRESRWWFFFLSRVVVSHHEYRSVWNTKFTKGTFVLWQLQVSRQGRSSG